jgi:predicted nucleotide-binding protein
MDKDTAIGMLEAAGLPIKSADRDGNDTGWQIRLDSGAIVNCYDKGTISFQGRNQDPARAALGLDAPVSIDASMQSRSTTTVKPKGIRRLRP